MEFSRQEYWSGLPFPTPGALSDPGIKPKSLVSPALAGGFFITKPPENPMCVCAHKHICIKNHHFCKKLVGGSTEDRCVCGVPELQIGWRYCPKPGDSLSPKLLSSPLPVLHPEKPGCGVEEAQNQDFPTLPSPTIILTGDYKECLTGPRQQDVP